MKLLFVDETDRQENAQNPLFFCICGALVDQKNLIFISNELEEIKKKYNLGNLKDSRKTGLDESVRISITKEIFDSLLKYEVKIIGVILGDFSLSAKLPKGDIYMGAMSFLLERFTLSMLSEKESGLVIFDEVNNNLENELHKRFYKFIREEKVIMKLKPIAEYKKYIYPALLFSDDNHNILIQAVDLIATSLNSAIFNCKKNGLMIVTDFPTKNKFLEIYWPLFATSPTGNVNGWGIKNWD